MTETQPDRTPQQWDMAPFLDSLVQAANEAATSTAPLKNTELTVPSNFEDTRVRLSVVPKQTQNDPIEWLQDWNDKERHLIVVSNFDQASKLFDRLMSTTLIEEQTFRLFYSTDADTIEAFNPAPRWEVELKKRRYKKAVQAFLEEQTESKSGAELDFEELYQRFVSWYLQHTDTDEPSRVWVHRTVKSEVQTHQSDDGSTVLTDRAGSWRQRPSQD